MKNLFGHILVILAVLGGMSTLTACEPKEGPQEAPEQAPEEGLGEDMGEDLDQMGE